MSWVGGTITTKRRAVVAAVVIGIKQNFGNKFPQCDACDALVFRVATLKAQADKYFLGFQLGRSRTVDEFARK
jgi:hypothetical protein